ncbi:MAG: hypothetical protein IJ849_09500 [Selenomonadaceae bacterium]|nr:hypothetical protein [Selenomonadaceae bacterium]
MSRAKNPRRTEAMRIYLESEGAKKPKELATLLGVTPGRVRTWKNLDKWDEELAKPLKERNIPKRKNGPPYGSKNAAGCSSGGAPKGNQNAKGHGPPKRNTNGVITGEYAKVYMDDLTTEEQFLLRELDTNPVAQLDEDIKVLNIRIHRMLKNIEGMKEKYARGELDEVTSTVNVDGQDKVMGKSQTRRKKPLLERILSAEDALLRVYDRKQKALAMKHTMMKEQGLYGSAPESESAKAMKGLTEEELRNLAKLAETE